jgi:cysteine-rich repeat protein
MSRTTRTTYAWATLAAVSSFMLATGCGDDPVTPPPVTKPAKILTFTADRTTVMSGERVTLSWTTQDATSITVRSASETLVNAATEANGSIMSGELTAKTTFTITAIGTGGNASTSVTVDIAAPSEVQIVAFSGTPLTVKPGDPVTLTWDTTNATSITLAAMGGMTIINADTTRLDGNETVNPMTTTTYVLTAAGASGSKTQNVSITVEGTPVVASFTGTPQAIELGEMATLAWNVTGAATITIVDGAGTEVYNGTMGQGSQVVSPTMSTAYTLTARSMLGQQVMSTPVMVTVNRAARVASFTANPSNIDYGDTSELRWSTSRTPGGVRITAGAVAVHTSSAAIGAFTVTPTVTTAYTLTAINPDGDTTAMASVTVNPIAPRIRRFDAAPNPARITEQATLSWSTLGAITVRVFDQTGTSIYSGTDADGTVAVTVTGTIARFTLEAINPNGGTTQTLDLVGQRDPIVDSLTVRPLTFVSTTTTATVTWRTTDATSTTLTLNGLAAPGFAGTASGSYSFTATTTVRLVLTARNDVGSITREAQVLRLADATVDTGRTASTAISLNGLPGVLGVIGPTGGSAGDLDYYSFTVVNGGSVYAETTNGRGGCTLDTLITLFAPDGTTVLGSDDDDGINNCSIIDPTRDAFATNLAAGTYYVQVRTFSTTAIGPYALTVTPNAPACGNGLFESRAGEQCDDRNTAAGDGCSATCSVEPLVTVMGPGAAQTVGGAITPAGNADYVRIDMLAPGYIGAEVFIPSRGRCDASGSNSADPVLTLFDSAFAVLGSDDNDGIASCSRIDPTFDTFAFVQAGTYYLRVTESGNDGTIPAYVLDVRTVGQGCGNVLLEGAEECDDGNAVDGDGCSQTCTFEGLREVEPNNTFATGTVIVTTTTSFIVRGSITPANDTDFFLIDVPAGYHIDAYITVNGLDQCPDEPEGQVALFNPAGTLQGSSNTTGGPQGNCGRVWPYTVTQSRGVTAGRYGIRVTETGANTAIGVYFLHVNLIAPRCGNRIIEGAEQCEDGNTVSGDGCTATCGFEPAATINLSALGTTTVAGAINPEFNRDALRITVTGTTTLLRAETFVDAASRVCPFGTNTRLRLFNDAGTELGTDATDGINSCSLINPQVDTFAALIPGNYWLVVEEDGNNTTIPNYNVVVRGIAANVCGNGVIEPNRGEQCDGQTFCSAQCQIVPQGVVTGPTGVQTFTGAISPIGDLDFYRVDVSAPSYIIVETGAPTIGTCPSADTVVRIFSIATSAELFSDDEDGPGSCSFLPGATGPAPLVQPGSYFVRVEDFGNNTEIAAYQVRINVNLPNLCGNFVRETGEACDDGNTAAGDGCSAVCAVEPQGVHTGPNTPPSTFTNSISVAGEIDRFEINVTATSYLRAETFSPTVGLCDGVDTLIRLSTSTELGSDDDDGVSNCSLITSGDGFARLTPGQYFLSVEEFGNNAAIAAYVLQVSLTAADICGNGLREPSAGEQCDDGNTAPGDGCSAACQNEPDGTVNGPTGNATTFSGAIEALADNDVYGIVLTQPSLVRIEANDPASATCATAAFTPALSLFSANGSTIETDTTDGQGNCSLIGDRVLPAGSYTVRINENGDNATLAAYSLVITTVALTTADGTFTGPSATPTTFTGAIDALGDVDVYRVTLSAPGRLTAETGSPMGTCASPIATVLRVFDPAGNELVVDIDDGVNGCSLIEAPDRVDLAAGTYYVVVEESGRNSLIASYEVRIGADAPPAYVCGDGFRDRTEGCDDGGTAAGDGCSATCTSEDPAMVQDNNANNAFGVAQNLGALAAGNVVNISATIVEGTGDWYRFTLAGPANVRINTYGTPGSVLTSCTMDSVMWLYNGAPGDPSITATGATQPTLVEFDDDDGAGPFNCSIISGTAASPTRRALTAGTYYVQVRRFGSNTAVGQYYLNVDVAP